MNVCIFDTETTSLEKPFCYNIGYLIADLHGHVLLRRDYVVEQIWHNLPLFSTAYYAEKRPIYVDAMRKHLTIMDKFGYICRQMSRDFKNYDVKIALAYNSPFDTKVFDFNCDWFKVNNPFDDIMIKDIRGFAHNFLIGDVYKTFCEENNLFTESGNYSTTAEAMYKFISGKLDFVEAHTALNDSEIEYEILLACLEAGADIYEDYPVKRSVERITEKELHIKTAEQTDFYFNYTRIRINKDKTEIVLR